MDQLSSMRVLVRVVDRGSFARAAADLRLSATMVGKHIQALETQLGCRLIQRTTRRQSLTEAGEVYYERCKALLSEVADAEAAVQNLRAVPRGTLRVTSPVTFGAHALAPALTEYLALYPEVKVDLTLSDRPLELVEERFDAAIRIGRLEDSSAIACPLRPYRTGLFATADYLSRNGTPRTPSDLTAHNCLGFTHWDHRSKWRLIGPTGQQTVRVTGNLTVNQGQALRSAALAGLGIVMQPETLFADDLTAGRVIRILPKWETAERPMSLVYPADRRLTPILRTFIDFVVTRYAPRPVKAFAPVTGGAARRARTKKALPSEEP